MAQEPRTVAVYRAQGIRQWTVQPVTIEIHIEMPDVEAHLSRATFASDAKAMAGALIATLPGGTVDALVAELLTRRASLLRVPLRETPARCPRCAELGKVRADGTTADQVSDMARSAYENAWPGRCWWDAPQDHRRAYIEVAALRFAEQCRTG